jgi:hypothetical protein
VEGGSTRDAIIYAAGRKKHEECSFDNIHLGVVELKCLSASLKLVRVRLRVDCVSEAHETMVPHETSMNLSDGSRSPR